MGVGKDIMDAVKMASGDWGCLTQLFFDNLSTLLGALFAIQDMVNFGVPKGDIDQVVWAKIVPGVGLTLIVGNMYYAWQGARLTNHWGRPYTAQVRQTHTHTRPIDQHTHALVSCLVCSVCSFSSSSFPHPFPPSSSSSL